jgi:hypothetical protein
MAEHAEETEGVNSLWKDVPLDSEGAKCEAPCSRKETYENIYKSYEIPDLYSGPSGSEHTITVFSLHCLLFCFKPIIRNPQDQ